MTFSCCALETDWLGGLPHLLSSQPTMYSVSLSCTQLGDGVAFAGGQMSGEIGESVCRVCSPLHLIITSIHEHIHTSQTHVQSAGPQPLSKNGGLGWGFSPGHSVRAERRETAASQLQAYSSVYCGIN